MTGPSSFARRRHQATVRSMGRPGDGILGAMRTGPRRWWSTLTSDGRRRVLLVALLLFAYGFFQQQPSWNEYSRYDLVRALVEQGTTRIDAYHENTGDKAFYDGHWYSDKAPGSALLGVPVYVLSLVTSNLATGAGPAQDDAVQALAFVESGIATAVLVLLLVAFLGPLVGERWAYAVGLAYGFGSMAFPFATMFFGHAASAAALFASFYLLYRHKERPGRWLPVAAGFFAGWAVLIEIPVVLGVAAVAVYALFLGRGVALRFVAGGLPLALILATYNWVSFGSPLSVGYMNLPPGGFAAGMSQGILGITWPSVDTLSDLLVGARGLLRSAPWLIAAPAGILAVRRRQLRAETIICIAIAALFLAYNAGYYLPFGGRTPGPRFLLPALPFAAVLVALAPARLRLLVGPLMLVGVMVFFFATITEPNAPERFEDPLFQLWLPRFAFGALAETAAWIRWGLPGSASLAVLLVGLGFGIVAVLLSFGRGALAARVAGRGALALTLMAVAFSLPFPPPAPIAVGWPGRGGEPAISVVELGHTPIRIGATDEVQLWVRIENRGGAIAASRLQFAVWRASGEGVWSAWYGEVSVPAASRRTVRMTWRPGADVSAGSYRYGFSVTDEATGATFGQAMAAGLITLGH